MNIDNDKLIEFLNVTQEELDVLSQLSSELWHGPYYLVAEDCAQETLTYKGETLFIGDWGSETVIGDAFPKLQEWASVIYENFLSKVYYDDDCGEFLEREPEGEFDISWLEKDERLALIRKYDLAVDVSDDMLTLHFDPLDQERYWCEPSPYYELDRQELLAELVGKRTASEMVGLL